MATLKEIQDFLENVSKNDLYKVKIKTEEIEMTIQFKPDVKVTQISEPNFAVQPQQIIQSTPVSTASTQAETPKEEENSSDENLITIPSPMVGTFYRKPAPDKPPFVEVGDTIKKGQTICIIEAMKLFNEIESEYDGQIVKILVDDATPVEFNQPLFLVKPL